MEQRGPIDQTILKRTHRHDRDARNLAERERVSKCLRQQSAAYGTLGSSCRLLPNVVQPASAYRQVEKFAQISAQCGGGRQ